MKRKTLSIALVLLCMALPVLAQDPYFRIDIDFQKQDTKWTVKAKQADTTLIRVFLRNDGNKWQPTSDYGGTIGYGTEYEDSTSLVTQTGVVSTTTNFIDFQMTAADMNTNGVFFGQIIITNLVSGRRFTWPNGLFDIKKNPIKGTASNLVLVDMPTGVLQGDLAFYSTNSMQWVRFAAGTTNRVLLFLGQGLAIPLSWANLNAQYLRIDGSVAMTGPLDMGNNSITNLSTNSIFFNDGTVALSKGLVDNWNAAFTHVSSDGTDHTFINQDMRTSASPSFAGLTLSESATNQADMVMVGKRNILNDTPDGADTNWIAMRGGGGTPIGRGAFILVAGNEFTSPDGGTIQLWAGNDPEGTITFRTGGGLLRFLINNDGTLSFLGNTVTNGTMGADMTWNGNVIAASFLDSGLLTNAVTVNSNAWGFTKSGRRVLLGVNTNISFFNNDAGYATTNVGQRMFSALRTNTQANIADTTFTTVQFNRVIEDTDSGWNAGTFQYTFPVTGIWVVAVGIEISSLDNAKLGIARLQHIEDSGATTNNIEHALWSPGADLSVGLIGYMSLNIRAVSDTMEAFAWHNNGDATPDIGGNPVNWRTRISAFYLGRMED